MVRQRLDSGRTHFATRILRLHDRMHPANAGDRIVSVPRMTPVRSPHHRPTSWSRPPTAIGRPDLLTDPVFSDPAETERLNMPQLTAIFRGETFCGEPMAHWYEVFNGVHVTSERCRAATRGWSTIPSSGDDIIVPLDGAAAKPDVIYHSCQHPASGAWRRHRSSGEKRAPKIGRTQRGGSPAARIPARLEIG